MHLKNELTNCDIKSYGIFFKYFLSLKGNELKNFFGMLCFFNCISTLQLVRFSVNFKM